MMHEKLKQLGILDTFGGIISLLCAIHCLFVPILTVFWPFFGTTFFADASFHSILLFAVVPIAVISLSWGSYKHKNYNPLLFGSFGLIVLVYFTLSEDEECLHCVEQAREFGIAFWNWAPDVLLQQGGLILGALLLCWAHWKNYITCKRSDCKS